MEETISREDADFIWSRCLIEMGVTSTPAELLQGMTEREKGQAANALKLMKTMLNGKEVV